MSYFWKMSQCNTTFDLKRNLGHSDLYLMVQWFLSFIFCSEKHLSFIDKARFRRATLSCDSSYIITSLSSFEPIENGVFNIDSSSIISLWTICSLYSQPFINEPPNDKTNKTACAPAKTKISLTYPLSAQRRLWSDAQADLSLRWAHSHFVGFIMRRLK